MCYVVQYKMDHATNDVQSISNNGTNENNECSINKTEGDNRDNEDKTKVTKSEITILQNVKVETIGSNIIINNSQVTEDDYEMDMETNCKLDNITSPISSDSQQKLSNNSNDKTQSTNLDLTSSSSSSNAVESHLAESEALPSSVNEPMNTLSDVSTHSVLNSVVKYVNDSNDTSNDFSTIVSTNVNIMNSSLSQLVDYGESDSDETSASSDFSDSNNENDANEMCNMISTEFIAFKNNTFRDINQSEGTYTETDSSSSSSSDSEDDSDIAICTDSVKPPAINKDKEETPRTKGELRLCDLPPIENLHISVPQQDCIEIGSVMSIVEELVVIQALPNMPPLDVDTVLFLNKGENALGRIFDVLGQVNEPCYTVRFNKAEDIPERGITPGTKVYCAPRTEHTAYVLVADLMKLKGSDASWKEDNEPPENCVDYSDDEAEQQARRGKRNRTRPTPVATTSFTRRETEAHPTDYEKRMNERNLQMNARYSSNGWGNIPPPQQPSLWRFAPMRDLRQNQQQPSVWYNYGPIGRPASVPAPFHPYADPQGCNNRFLRSPMFHAVPNNPMYLPPPRFPGVPVFPQAPMFDAVRVPVCPFPPPPPPPPTSSSSSQQTPHGQ